MRHSEGPPVSRVDADRPVLGVVAVIERDGRWLMIQRADDLVAGGSWCFPGGAVEFGESRESALVRELDEELGVCVRPERFLWRWRRDDGGLLIEWWRAGLIGGALAPNPAEVQALRWLRPVEIRDLHNILPNNVAFVDYAERAGLWPV